MSENAKKKDLILIVDDDPGVLQLFEMTLRGDGLNFVSASSGSQAIAKIDALKPRLVLLDLALPDFGGLELLALMRRRDPSWFPSVIVITGRSADAAFKETLFRDPHIVAYLEKPVEAAELLGHIHGVLDARPAISERGCA